MPTTGIYYLVPSKACYLLFSSTSATHILCHCIHVDPGHAAALLAAFILTRY